MDVQKRKIIKSKSSNTAMVRKTEKKNTKCKSSPQIEDFPKIVKKRGVYVEHRPVMSMSAQGQNIIKENKPAPPPRVGRKRFLNSVLTILSKSSTGTQHPDQEERKPKLKKKISVEKKQNPLKNEEVTEMRKESSGIKIKVEPEKKKKKFRSRVLNMDRDYADKFKVIQRTKDIRFSPIDSSSREDFKYSEFSRLVKNNDQETTNIVRNIVKKVSESQKLAGAKVEQEPTTLVADVHKKDEKLYDLIVDLLETTFTLYDVKDRTDKAVKSVCSSKVTFEIDEQVAQKLKVIKPPTFDDITQKPSRAYHNIITDHEWDDGKTNNFSNVISYSKSPHSNQPLKSPVKRNKLKSASFPKSHQATSSKNASPSTQSVTQKKTKQKPKKRDLLNILKEELAKGPSLYEEPQSIYDALKMMARNKRKCQKNIRFANVKKNTGVLRDDDDCMKKRKIMRPSASFRYNKQIGRKSPKNKDSEKYYDVREASKYNMSEIPNNDYQSSVHSIEVYGFDYCVQKKFRAPRRKE